ncbi:hypothetical protein A5780_19220 [Nocardia sp. 852002-20019_SCH5090214]|uniref:hypothetical protein n=1 Tax=Nocardia sp. 852002-20019_SCH5090214 TaxID=1834087 RepID=UPI0007EC19D8|nr:hypothetical protein [Nocardia sp. 852002-20019_SCH5090214]OBA62191.1 hypothetical protein A5780_19220 [Nocardia sp. 852002-20019_SCH5090214]
MGDFITEEDLTPFASIDPDRAEAMIADAEALAVEAAPCIAEAGFTKQAALKAILRGAILRWNDSGTGAVTTQTAGPYAQTFDTRQTRRSLFWPSEIEQLQNLCATSGAGKAFSVDTVPLCGSVHADTCSLTFGALYCSCGADLAGVPLWGDV